MKLADYLTQTEKQQINYINSKLDSCNTEKELQAYKYSICLLLERALNRYDKEKNEKGTFK